MPPKQVAFETTQQVGSEGEGGDVPGVDGRGKTTTTTTTANTNHGVPVTSVFGFRNVVLAVPYLLALNIIPSLIYS